MRLFGRILLALAICTTLLVVAAPYALYRLGLHGIEGRPAKPLRLATPEQQQWVWTQFKASGLRGERKVVPLDPCSYAYDLLSGHAEDTQTFGNLLAWNVARPYLMEHRRFKGMGWWHLSGEALSIWLTRNWSTEELLSQYWQEGERKGLTPRLVSTARD